MVQSDNGAVSESWVASEIPKWRLNRGHPADLFHLREARGLEIDLLVEGSRTLTPVEVKSGQTVEEVPLPRQPAHLFRRRCWGCIF